MRAVRLLAPLAAGAAIFGVLTLMGAGELGWLGFMVVGLLWSAAGRSRPPPRPAGAASAAEPAGTPAGGLPAGRYVLDPERSVVHLRVRKLGAFVVRATLPVTGAVDLAADPAASRVVAAAAAAGFRTGSRARDAHVRRPAFLDAARHPYLRFESTAVLAATPGTWTVSGALTVRGTTRPVAFRVRVTGWSPESGPLLLSARTHLRRSEFGVAAFGWLVGDGVGVCVDASARRG